jgi:membrane associated rhomboid family serine protease
MQQFRPSGFQVLPPIVKNLLIINGLMFLATTVLETQMHVDLTRYLGLHYFTSPYFMPHQLLTHMFMHGNFTHILSNMFALWMFGSLIENYWGPKRFLIYYLICGLGGALLHQGVTAYEIHGIQQDVNAFMARPTPPSFVSLFERNQGILYDGDLVDRANALLNTWRAEPTSTTYVFKAKELAQELTLQQANIPVVGASGAVFGVLLAFGMMFPNMYIYLYFFIPLKAKYFVIIYGLFELYAGVTGTQSGVAHFAHLGGMLFGFLMIKYWNRSRRHDIF